MGGLPFDPSNSASVGPGRTSLANVDGNDGIGAEIAGVPEGKC
jgi:hypothetical protein